MNRVPMAARLRHRITIEQLTVTRDAIGGVIETWSALHQNVPADIVPLSGREFMAAQSTQSSVTVRVTVRYLDGLTPLMRVVHGSDVYNVEAVLPDPSLRRHLTLMCSSVRTN